MKEEVARLLQVFFRKKGKYIAVDGKERRKLHESLEQHTLFGTEDMLVFRLCNSPRFDFTKDLLQWIASGSILVILDLADSLHKDKKVYTWVKENGCIVNCKRYEEYKEDARKLVIGLLRMNGKTASLEVAKELLARSGGDSMRTVNMVRLLALGTEGGIDPKGSGEAGLRTPR